jgi:hypothetical protein
MCLINVLGNQEARIKGQDSPIMRIRPDVVGVGNAVSALASDDSAACDSFACSADRI